MPHKYSCCVPNCSCNFRNCSSSIQFYRIPKDPHLRKQYVVLLKNDNLKVDSSCTRICSHHWDGGRKLSRMHLPSIFPWSKPVKERRKIERMTDDDQPKRRKIETQSLNEGEQPQTKGTEKEQQTNSLQKHIDDLQAQLDNAYKEISNLKSNSEEQLEESRNQIKTLKDSYENQLEQSRKQMLTFEKQLEESKKEVVKLNYKINNIRFDIDKYKTSDKDIQFYTGFTNYQLLENCFSLIEKSAMNLNYGTREKVYENMQGLRRIGRPRALSTFQEFILVLLHLRLGLLERDLSHRFLISESSVSAIVKTWLRFLKAEFESLVSLPPNEVISSNMLNVGPASNTT